MISIKKLFVVVIVLATIVSCTDLEPLDQLGGETMWKTKGDYQLFANNFYGWTRTFSTNNSDAPHSDFRSDLVTGTVYNEYSKGVNTIPSSDGNYTGNYNNIRRTNLLLQNAASYSRPEEIKTYVGEAYFFRAYSYFDLLQLYGDVIITKTPLDINSPEMNMPRNNRIEVADFIVEDLKKAIENLPSYSALGSAGYGRISKEGAQAFLSRVALYEGTWQKIRGNVSKGNELLNIAAIAAKSVIDSNQFYLFGTQGASATLGDSAQKYMFILENQQSNPAFVKKPDNHEYIFGRNYDEILLRININLTKGHLNNAIWVTRKFANMYLCDDGLPIEKSSRFQGYAQKDSEFANRDNRMKYTLLVPGSRYYNNVGTNCRIAWNDTDISRSLLYNPSSNSCYNNQKWAAERLVPDNYEGYDYPIIRFAEVLLNYAEAVYERDDAITDADLDLSLNKVRNRANKTMPKLSNALVNSNGLSMREEIRRERTIELYLEGFRVDDLKRWKTAETEMPQDMLGIKWQGTQYQTVNFSFPKNPQGCIIIESGRVWADKNYLYPIPIDQLQLNPKLGQNPGWNN